MMAVFIVYEQQSLLNFRIASWACGRNNSIPQAGEFFFGNCLVIKLQMRRWRIAFTTASEAEATCNFL